MAAQDKTTIKSYFETGDKPTQLQFEQFIDSTFVGPNVVFVYQKSDFPAAISGVITLEDGVTYFITAVIDLEGARLVGGVNTTIIGGSSENCRIKSTGLSGTALITSEYSLPIKDVSFEAELILDLNGDGINTALDWRGINFVNSASVGTIANMSNVIIKDSAIINSGGLTFDGNFDTIGIEGSLILPASGSTGITIPATATITRRFRVTYSALIVGTGITGINVNDSATVPVEGYILDTINFSGAGTYLIGVDYLDNKALFQNNRGITNTAEIGQYSMVMNATATTFSATDTPTKILGTTTANSINQKFSHSNNRLTYTGALTRLFTFSAIATLSGGNAKEIGMYLAKNGNPTDSSETYATTNAGGRAENIAIQDIIELSQGDYIEVWLENSTDTSSVTAESLNVIIRSIS